jgi:ABC-type sugar transport system ATPase subunit
MAEVTLEEVTKVFGEDVVAVDKMNLDIPDGEFVVFVGPSGCGKSTALRMIAGLEDITGGKVFIGDQVVNDLPPRQRDIAMVFQNYALYPHMNVRENMGFALKLRKLDKSEISRRVDEAARILSIERFLDRKPKALSGGQRQRVALGRAIVREPKAFLMDDHPNNVFVAGFIGSPAMNFLRARLEKENGGYTVTFGSTRMSMSREVVEEVKERRGQDLGEHVGEIVLGIRPEHMEDAQTEAAEALGVTDGSNSVDVEAQVIESMGSEKYIYFEPPREQAVHLSSVAEMTEDDEGGAEQDTMGGSAEDVGGNLMVARVAPESTAREGQTMRLVVDPSKIRIFDLETEQAIL